MLKSSIRSFWRWKLSETSEEQQGEKASGNGGVDYRTACLRLPQFPLQLLLHQKPEWRGKRVVWLDSLKADSRVRYLSVEASRAGVHPGARYATILGVVPDLLAGTCTREELQRADRWVVERLRQFTPQIRHRSRHLENGLYLLDAGGLSRAFKGMKRWAKEVVKSFRKAGWDARLAVGFTPFATEMATYHLALESPIRLFQSRAEEEKRTLETSLSAFSLSPDQIERLRRFQILTLGDFLMLEPEEVKRRFGGDLREFYEKAAGAIFCSFPPLQEREPLVAQKGFHTPVSDLPPILESTKHLLHSLLPQLLEQEQAVSAVHLEFHTEDNFCHRQCLRPTYPTADLDWVMTLIKLRLEKYFQQNPLRWGSRVERVFIELSGEIDPEKQGDLFTDWAIDMSGGGEERLSPRDKEAGLWALSQVRAEFGECSLVRARLEDHHLPDRDHSWRAEKESLEWLSRWKKKTDSPERPDRDLRVRRILYQPVGLSRRNDWSAEYGPYLVNGGWWGESFVREYCFAQKEEQTAWLYEDVEQGRWRVQGWLQ